MRLIDANLAIERQWFNNAQPLICRQYAVDVLRDAPTVDAVEVVRCKDCKHFSGHGACHCHAADENGTPIFVREEDFCSYGERRTDGSEG